MSGGLGNFANYAKTQKANISDTPAETTNEEIQAKVDVESGNETINDSVEKRPIKPDVTAAIKSRMIESQRDESALILMVNQISPDPHQPRKSFDDVVERADSIRMYGLLQSIVVRVDPENPNRYIIIAGETRWRAYSEILITEDPVKFSTIKTVVREAPSDASDTLLLQLIENIQRTDLKPLEEAATYLRIKESKGINNKELAGLVNKSESRVSRILKLLKLSDDDKARIDSGELSARDVQREKGTNAATKMTPPSTDKTKPRDSKLSISMQSAKTLAELLKVLAVGNDLSDIDLGKESKKDLIAILETRSPEILESVKK